MTSYLETLEAPYLGLNTVSGPLQIGKGYCPDLVNVLTGQPGSVPARGGMHRFAALPKAYTAAWPSRAGTILLGAAGDTTLKVVDSSFAVSNLVVASADQVPSTAFAQVGDVVYGIGRNGHLLRWASGAVTKYANAPTGGTDTVFWKNRIWYLAGKLPGDAAARTDQLGWSDLTDGSAALSDTAASWQDDVSGLTNRIVLGSISGTNQPVGFGVLPNALLIFGSKSVDMLVGSSPANITVRARVLSRGCVDKRTIVEYAGAILWLAPEGFYAYDGVNDEVELSGNIRNTMTELAATVSAAGGSVSATLLPNDYVMLVSSVPLDRGRQAWLLHVPTRSWSYFDSGAVTLDSNTFGFVGRQGAGDGHGFLCGTDAIWDVDNVTQRLALNNMFGQELSNGAGLVPITSTIRHRNRALSGPITKAKISRVDTDSLGGGLLTLNDVDGTEVARQSLPSTGARTRQVSEVFGEVTELSAEVLIGGGAGPAELYDSYIEYDSAQKPTSWS